MNVPLFLSASANLNKFQRKLRIAVFNRTFSTTGGGAERYSVALVEQLAARHDIHVFAQEIDHQWPGVTYHRVSAPLRKPRWINQLWFAFCTWWATRRGFDVVHSHENTWHVGVGIGHGVAAVGPGFRRDVDDLQQRYGKPTKTGRRSAHRSGRG